MRGRLPEWIAALVLVTGCTATLAQNSDVDRDYYSANVFAGGGISSNGTSSAAMGQAGGSAGIGTVSQKVGGFGSLEFAEIGTVGPLATRPTATCFLSFDLGTNMLIGRKTRNVPFAAAGYSYLFGAGNAVNFGAGVDHYYKAGRAIRIEVRDYYTFTGATQHHVAIRIGWEFGVHNT